MSIKGITKLLQMGCLSACGMLCAGDFAVQNPSEGIYNITYRGKVLIDSITTTVSSNAAAEKRRYSRTVLPDGSEVFNIWSEEKDRRFRTEIALLNNGSVVEMTFMSETRAFAPTLKDSKLLQFTIPYEHFANGSFCGYTGRAIAAVFKKGSFRDLPVRTQMANSDWRYLVLNDGSDRSIVLDFNPVGPGDFISIYPFGALKGLWHCRRDTDKLRFFGGSKLQEGGGFTGTKVRIFAGDMTSYKQAHALEKFFYDQAFAPERLYSFGAVKHGKQYTAADDLNFDAARQSGWLGGSKVKLLPGKYPGAYYSNVSGKDACFRVNGLLPGLYIVTLGIGNMQKVPCKFDFECNGEVIARDVSVSGSRAKVISRAVWIEKGQAEFIFKGDFLISTLALQRLISVDEDFSFRRGPWVTDGFEPGNIFRNRDYRPAPVLVTDVQEFALPVPGTESAGPRKNTPDQVLSVNEENPELRWRYRAIFGSMMNNSSTLGELDDPESREIFFRQQQQRHVNTLLLSGLHSRHTYFNHLKRGQKTITFLAQEAHKRNMKLIDHHDVTLLWNLDGGFRVLAERLPEVTRNIHNQLPGYQFCIMNPDMNRKYTAYIMELVRGGVDGFMLDEAHFYPDCCSCQYCREAFYRDTNYQIPVNELDDFFTDKPTELKQAWLKWRKQKVGDWWVNIRRAINQVNPATTLLVYSTHYGFTDRWAPLRLGADLFEDARGADFIGTEIMTRNILRSARTVPGYRKAKNMLRTAYGYPVWGLIQTQLNWDANYFGWAMVNMHAQTVWMINPIKDEGRKSFLTFKDNMDMARAVDVANVALLFSSASRDFAPVGAQLGELFGTAQTLDAMHIPYAVIGQMSLQKSVLDKYKVLIIGGAGCLSDPEVEAIKTFARDGGKVLITANSGIYDENGLLRKKWAFTDVFGQAPAVESAMVRRFALPGIERINAEKPVRFFPLAKRREHYLVKQYGKGSMHYLNLCLGSALYAPEGTPGRMWTFQLDPAVDDFYKRFLNEFTEGARCWEVKAPDLVLTTLYRQDDQMVAHFLNATGCSNTFNKPMEMALPDPAFPVLSEDITFTLPDKWQSAYAVSPDFEGKKALAVRQENNQFIVTLPADLLKVYTIVFVQKK